jgi:ketosteroid isomerase-like protein
MRKLIFCLLPAAIIFILSCNNSGTTNTASEDSSNKMKAEKSFDLDKARAAIDEENRRFMDDFKRGDSAALAAHYAADGMVLAPNVNAVKKDGLAALWGSFIRSGIKDLKISPTDVAGDAEMLTETGMYELYGDNNKVLDKGKYVVVWKNENDSWKIFRDIFNTSQQAGK